MCFYLNGSLACWWRQRAAARSRQHQDDPRRATETRVCRTIVKTVEQTQKQATSCVVKCFPCWMFIRTDDITGGKLSLLFDLCKWFYNCCFYCLLLISAVMHAFILKIQKFDPQPSHGTVKAPKAMMKNAKKKTGAGLHDPQVDMSLIGRSVVWAGQLLDFLLSCSK